MDTKKKYKILIVDDSRFNRLVMTSMLAKDYFLEEACDGKQAMWILQDHAEEFSLILLDIVMPNMDGFEFLKALKECGWLSFIPVIMISSEYTPENIERAYSLGASELIQRPYDEQIIRHRIDNTIALSGKQRALSSALVNEIVEENENSTAMVSVLSHIVETRNGESGAHVRNIRYITEMLLNEITKRSDQYSFSAKVMLQIVNASALHDIGKMSVPEEILNKPGKLTDEEFQIIKGHAMAGANMVEPLLHNENVSPIIRMTYEICRWHHERYDGRGYPDGLKGDDIPIAVQAVSVADVYDALTSERCYKPAYTPEQAVQMIRDGQCGAFNPLLLDCLSVILDRRKDSPDFPADMSGDNVDSKELLVTDILTHSHENGLPFSDKIMQTVRRERLRAKFFFNGSCPAFYYTVSPPALHLNKAGREFYRVDKSTSIPKKELTSYEGYDHRMIELLRTKLAEATNERPFVKAELLLGLHGEPPQRYQCVMQTIWDSPDAQHYAEVAGKLIPLEGETSMVSPDDVMEEFLTSGSVLTGMGTYYLICALKFMVYNVRLVDPSDNSIVEIDSSGMISKSGQCCYKIWKQDQRCVNCTSMKCLAFQKEFSKIVFFDNEVFHVISQYVKVDGTPLVLEMLTRITDDALLDQGGKKLPSKSISDLRSKVYLDPITHVYNRRYYDAKAQTPGNICALAIINVDHFKDINSLYGRTVGDKVLLSIAEAIGREKRTLDTLVRYDGDEFVMMFASISPDTFEAKLEKICGDISALSIDGMEEGQHISVSIGGAVGPDVPAALMKKADEMLRKAKNNRGTVEVWD